MVLLYFTMALAIQAATSILLSLAALAFASFATKGVSILSLVSLPTCILLLSPELDVELSKLERSSGEQRGNQRGDWTITLLSAVAVFHWGAGGNEQPDDGLRRGSQ
jgi:hypothetical protein